MSTQRIIMYGTTEAKNAETLGKNVLTEVENAEIFQELQQIKNAANHAFQLNRKIPLLQPPQQHMTFSTPCLFLTSIS